MIVNASVKNIRISPRKLRLVVDQVRGMKVQEAQKTLSFLHKKGSEPVLKLINSAVANAGHNFKLDTDNLFIKTIQVDEGFTIKRFRARAFGRAGAIRKRTSRMQLTLEERKPEAKAKKKEVAVTEEKVVVKEGKTNNETK